MMTLVIRAFAAVFLLAAFAQQSSAQSATGPNLYVAPTGSDDYPGTAEAPFATIGKAATLTTPGTTVHVAPGTYVGNIRTAASGNDAARIRFVSDVKWGARIVPPPGSLQADAWYNSGSYVDIDGFEFDGLGGNQWRNGIVVRGSVNRTINNHVHDISTSGVCDSDGGAGISTSSFEGGVNDEVTGNVVHHIGYAGCRFIHGIYIATSGSVINNLVYQIGKAGIHLWHDAANVTISNNTVFGSGIGIIVGGGEFYRSTGPADHIVVSNNIVHDNRIGIQEAGSVGTHNLYISNLLYANVIDWKLLTGIANAANLSADPQFINYVRNGGGDYRLKKTSPAIGKGAPAYAPSTDINGIARPQGGKIDIGAFQHGSL